MLNVALNNSQQNKFKAIWVNIIKAFDSFNLSVNYFICTLTKI